MLDQILLLHLKVCVPQSHPRLDVGSTSIPFCRLDTNPTVQIREDGSAHFSDKMANGLFVNSFAQLLEKMSYSTLKFAKG
jgi:hypothetical protein